MCAQCKMFSAWVSECYKATYATWAYVKPAMHQQLLRGWSLLPEHKGDISDISLPKPSPICSFYSAAKNELWHVSLPKSEAFLAIKLTQQELSSMPIAPIFVAVPAFIPCQSCQLKTARYHESTCSNHCTWNSQSQAGCILVVCSQKWWPHAH